MVSVSRRIILSAVLCASFQQAAWAEEKESTSTLISTATRHEMRAEEVAADIKVITADEISKLPVRDVAEALNYLTGIVISRSGSLGMYAAPSIRGSDSSQVQVLIDDIPMNTLTNGDANLSLIPLNYVERIEIQKGSASSAWGASLAGVINIITRKPSEEFSAVAGTSFGEENTRGYKGGISGTSSGVGYLLTMDRMETDGFMKGQDAEINHIYGKLSKKLGDDLSLTLSYGYNETDQGLGEFPDYGFLSEWEGWDSYGKAEVNYAWSSDLDLSFSLYDRNYYNNREDTYIGDTTPYYDLTDREHIYGAIFKAGWRYSGDGTLSGGAEGSRSALDFSTEPRNYYSYKSSVYLNDTHRIQNLVLNAGIRFDEDTAYGSEVSPSAGLVYDIKPAATLLRLNAARGFTPPPLSWRYTGVEPNRDLNAERAWTYEAGLETRAVPWVTAKVTFYRADATDGVDWVIDENDVDGDLDTFEVLHFKNIKDLRRQGVEAEVRTDEYKGLTLSYGYAFNDIRDLDLHETVKNRPRVTHDVGLDYRGPFQTTTTLRGHYIYWNAEEFYHARDDNFTWDARVAKFFGKWKSVMGEVFVSVHNLTDEDQYMEDYYPNPRRWVEAGLNLTFF